MEVGKWLQVKQICQGAFLVGSDVVCSLGLITPQPLQTNVSNRPDRLWHLELSAIMRKTSEERRILLQMF